MYIEYDHCYSNAFLVSLFLWHRNAKCGYFILVIFGIIPFIE